MKKLIQKIREKKGFTLAELLIVVAIIAVLVAIAIPIFTTQLEKSREATDLANLRAAYAECATDILTADTTTYTSSYKKVSPKQTTSGWVTSPVPDIGAVKSASVPNIVAGTDVYMIVKADGTAEISTSAPRTGGHNLDSTT